MTKLKTINEIKKEIEKIKLGCNKNLGQFEEPEEDEEEFEGDEI